MISSESLLYIGAGGGVVGLDQFEDGEHGGQDTEHHSSHTHYDGSYSQSPGQDYPASGLGHLCFSRFWLARGHKSVVGQKEW